MSHFTALLIIEKVEEAQPAKNDQYGKVVTSAVPRSTSETVKIVVRADNLIKLREKITAHVELIE